MFRSASRYMPRDIILSRYPYIFTAVYICRHVKGVSLVAARHQSQRSEEPENAKEYVRIQPAHAPACAQAMALRTLHPLSQA